MKILEPKVARLEIDLREGAVAWNGPYMHNLAAQILLFVIGDQPKSEVEENHYFQNLLSGHRLTVIKKDI